MATKKENIKLRTCNSTTITQMGRCEVKVENSRFKICDSCTVRESTILLVMPHIEKLDILTINCNTIDTKEADRVENHITNTANYQEYTCEKQYINMR